MMIMMMAMKILRCNGEKLNHPGRVEQALVPTKLRTVKQRVQSVGIVDMILYH